MKHNNNNKNISLWSSILLCFALLGQCKAHFPLLHNRHAYPPDASHQSYSGAPGLDKVGSSPASAPSHDHHHSGHDKHHHDQSNHDHDHDHDDHGHEGPDSPSFKSSFSDILRGTLRGHAMTMPEQVPNSQNEHNKDLKQICSHTDYPDVCFSTISPLIKEHDFDIINVLHGAIKACSAQIKIAMEKMKKSQSKVPSEHLGASMFSDCKEQYKMALENLKRANDAIPSRDLATVTITLSAAVADVSACESTLQDLKKSHFNAKTDSDGLVGIMTSNCLAIAHMVPH